MLREFGNKESSRVAGLKLSGLDSVGGGFQFAPRPRRPRFPKFAEALVRASRAVDAKLAALLGSGELRLLLSSWFLARGPRRLMRYKQIPEEAFAPAEVAVAALQRADRSLLVLRYAPHPPRLRARVRLPA